VKLKHVAILLSLTVLLLGACKAKEAGTSEEGGKDLRSDVQALQQQMAEQKQLLEAIKSDVAAIKSGIEEARVPPAQQAERPRPVSIDDDYIRGREDAPLTLIEFSDFECPFCERFFRDTLPQIDQEYIRTGKVRMVYRDFPIARIHKNAVKAAEAAQCAGEQGKYWDMHDMIFKHSKAMSVADLKKYARELKVAGDRFDNCLDSGKYADEVKKDLMDARALGVEGTPTFFVGYTGPDKTVQAYEIGGARPYEVYKEMFDRLLQEKETKKEPAS